MGGVREPDGWAVIGGQRRDRRGRWTPSQLQDPGQNLLGGSRTSQLLPNSTPAEAATFLGSLQFGQPVQLTDAGRTEMCTVEIPAGREGHTGVTFRAAGGTRSRRRTVTVDEVTAGFSPTITVEPQWEAAS